MYYYILNPAAGKGAVNQMQDKLRERLRELGIEGEFAKTTGPGDATKMAKAAIAKGATTLVAVGGDGTVNEVVNGVTGENIAVGIIPIGNSNTLARRLGIANWQQACETLAARRITNYGLIAAGQKYFLSTLTLGFETDLDKQVESSAPDSSLGSRLTKLWQARGHAQNYETLQCRIQIDDNLELKAPLFSLSVTNQKFENPLAENRLEVTLVDRPSGRQLTSYLWSVLKKDEIHEGISRFAAKRVVIETTPPTGIMIDGKLSGRTPIAIRITTKQIRFITEKQIVSFKAE